MDKFEICISNLSIYYLNLITEFVELLLCNIDIISVITTCGFVHSKFVLIKIENKQQVKSKNYVFKWLHGAICRRSELFS